MRADTGTAAKTAVPPTTWRMAPAQLRASHAASITPHGGRGARMSSMSSWITASVAAVPPASAVSSTPPASTASIAAPTPSAATVPSCQLRGWSVRRMAAGTRITRPNANDDAVESEIEAGAEAQRTEVQLLGRAHRQPEDRAARAPLPRLRPRPMRGPASTPQGRGPRSPRRPRREGRPAPAARLTACAVKAPLLAQSVDGRADPLRAFLQLPDDVEWRLGAEFLVRELGFRLLEVGC